jgi:hypothetical protein
MKSIGMSRKSILLTKALSFAELINTSEERIASSGGVETLSASAGTPLVGSHIR